MLRPPPLSVPRQEFFETIDVDPSDAKGLLEVIDIDGNGKARVACCVFFGAGSGIIRWCWEEKGETFSSRIWSRRAFYNPNGG